MKRRDFIAGVGAAAAWPVAAKAQRNGQARRIGVLSQGSIRSHPTLVFRAFLDRLQQLGWFENQNLEMAHQENEWVNLMENAA